MINDRKYVVYKHTSPSGKVYIGITCLKPEERWKNGLGYRKQQLFYRAIEKYGWDRFTHEILFSGLSEAEAKAMEIELIRRHDSINPRKGYNVSAGGDGTSGVILSDERKAEISKQSLAMWEKPEYRERMNRIAKEKWATPEYIEKHRNSMYRYYSSEKSHTQKSQTTKALWEKPDYRRKVSAGQKAAWDNQERRNAQSKRSLGMTHSATAKQRISERKIETTGVQVAQVDPATDQIVGIYRAVQEAARTTGISAGNITRCAKGRCHKAGGFSWKYVEEADTNCLTRNK